MKKVAVLIYDKFCNFEISVALEMLAMAEKPFVVLSKSLEPVRSEEGIKIILPKEKKRDIEEKLWKMIIY